jgi:putative SbcD/Mre11-related phosphoesterase
VTRALRVRAPSATGALLLSRSVRSTVPDLPRDLAFARRCLYVEPADALVLADVHLGRDRASAVQLPLGERADVLERLGAALDRFEPGEVVVAGDLLHSYGRVPDGVEDSVDELWAAVETAGAELVVTPGNHDGVLDAVFDGPAPAEHVLDDGTVVCHGHERPEPGAPRYVLGHDHPAVTIEGRRHPCFLYGEATVGDGDVVVLPAFSRLARGVSVGGHRDGFLSPVLSGGAGDYRPVVYEDDAGEALAFPPLSELREHL